MLIRYKRICFSLVLRKITFTLLPQMHKLLRNFLRTNRSEEFYTTLIANTLIWLSGKGQSMYPLGTGKQFTDSSTTNISIGIPENVDL